MEQRRVAIGVLAAMLEGQPFTYAGLGLDTDIESVAARFPNSARVGDYIYVVPRDSKDHVTGIRLSGAGSSRMLRIAFEASEGNSPPTYPSCADIQRGLEKRYGAPSGIRNFYEEASRRSDRIWNGRGEEMRLLCFVHPGQTSPLYAEAITVARGKERP